MIMEKDITLLYTKKKNKRNRSCSYTGEKSTIITHTWRRKKEGSKQRTHTLLKERDIDLEFFSFLDTFGNRRYLSKKKKNTRRKNCRKGFLMNRGRKKIISIFACHRHIICCCCRWLILCWNWWWSHGIHIRRWNISMLKEMSSLLNKSYKIKDILHWTCVHLLDDYHFEYKMLDRKMVVIAKYKLCL